MATNLDRASTVSRHVQIDSVVLRAASFESLADPLDPAVELEAQVSYRASATRRRDRLLTRVDFRLEASPQGKENTKPIATLSASFLLVYVVPENEEFAEDALKHFAELNGTYNAWPYWRELVQTASGRAGLAVITVPVFRPPVKLLEEPEKVAAKKRRAASTQKRVNSRASTKKRA